MFVLRDLLALLPRLRRHVAYREHDLQRGEPVYTLSPDMLSQQTFHSGWLVTEVRTRWVRPPHMPYCHRADFEHPQRGYVRVYTGYNSGPHVRASDKKAWTHFLRGNAQAFQGLNTQVIA